MATNNNDSPAALAVRGFIYALLCIPAAVLVIVPIVMPLTYTSRVKRAAVIGDTRKLKSLIAGSAVAAGLAAAVPALYFASIGDETMGFSTVLGMLLIPFVSSFVYMLLFSSLVYASSARNTAGKLYAAFAIVVAAGIIGLAGVAYYRTNIASQRDLAKRLEATVASLQLPAGLEPVSTADNTLPPHTTGGYASAVEVRTYKADMPMAEANRLVTDVLAKQNQGVDAKAYAALYADETKYNLEESRRTCSPVQIAIRPDTMATAVFSTTAEGAKVRLNTGDGIIGVHEYMRQACDETVRPSYVTIVYTMTDR